MAVKKTTRKKSAKTTATKKSPVRKTASARTAPLKAAERKTQIKTSAATGAAASTQPFLKEMEKIMTKQQPFQFDQLAQEAANSSREGVEAFVKSGEIFAKGFEKWMKTAASIAQNAGEKQAELTRQLMGSKTLNELAEAQNKIAQANFDQFMQGATQLSEMGVKLLSEASEPLNTQITKAMEKANKQMAA
ncbi:MAG: phasin family protein [Alphaproteobacteria bacterium]